MTQGKYSYNGLCITTHLLLLMTVSGCQSSHEHITDFYNPSSCALQRASAYVEDPTTTPDELIALGLSPITAYFLHTQAETAREDIWSYNKPDILASLSPDELATIVDFVGPGFCPQTDQVVFSPQPLTQSHLSRIVSAIDQAQKTIDIAIYGLDHDEIILSLNRAKSERNVSIRVLYSSAIEDFSPENFENSLSANLLESGIEIRGVNITNHHKFAIIDGPRDFTTPTHQALLINGSANWSYGAAMRYDENTIFLPQNNELLLRFQVEFNYLWKYSQGLESLSDIPPENPGKPIIPDDPSIEVLFTSHNFTANNSSTNPTFSLNEESRVVEARLLGLIRNAESSIYIASGHVRLPAIFTALVEKTRSNPNIDIRVYTDQQEYRNSSIRQDEQVQYETCQEDCDKLGLHFANLLPNFGIPVRYKVYSYSWNYATAKQMHHKYFIIDKKIVASGSYNLSNNSEQNSFENLVIYSINGFPDLVQAFTDNFDALWTTGEPVSRYERLMEEISTGSAPILLDFPPMALTWEQVTALRNAIRSACPHINDFLAKNSQCPR